jgi:hypothetical protein
LSFPIKVTGHLSDEKESDDKPDTFTVSFEALEQELKIGLQPAKAKIKIKALDDVIKSMFPNGHEFVLNITERYESQQAPEERAETTATTLEVPAEEPVVAPQELCSVCKVPLAICQCTDANAATDLESNPEEATEEPPTPTP